MQTAKHPVIPPMTAPTDSSRDDRFDLVPLSAIRVVYNPRRYFDPAQHAELVADIGLRGVLQPMLVRPDPDATGESNRYLLVSGERRLRAAAEALGETGIVPVYVRHLTDEQAVGAATSENENRQSVSETEQADAAAKLLALTGNDRAETARRLGWSTHKLDRRLALATLSDAAKTALDSRTIMLGHAEILAAVPPDKQDRALATILDNSLTVAATRDLLSRMTHQLATAIFDRTECAGCPYNSTTQRSLFATTVQDGACTNPACYDIKTDRAVAAATVVAPPPAATPAPAIAEEAGSPAEDDTDADAETSDAAVTEPGTRASGPADTDAARPTMPAAGRADTDKEARSAARRSAREVREAAWRSLLARHLFGTPKDAMRFLAIVIYADQSRSVPTGSVVDRTPQLLSEGFLKRKPSGRVKAIVEVPEDRLTVVTSAIASGLAKDHARIETIYDAALAFGLDLRAIWTLDASFLKLFTKGELRIIATETGLVDHLGARSFARLLNGKRDQLIAGMLGATGFSWSNRLPSCMAADDKPRLPPAMTDLPTPDAASSAPEQAEAA